MFKQDKREIFSFRKFKNGRTDSALIGATVLALGLGFMTTTQPVFASELETNSVAIVEKPSDNKNVEKVQTESVSNEVKPQLKVAEKEVVSDSKDTVLDVKEVKPSLEETKSVEKEEVKVSEKLETPKLDKFQLESYISEIEANLSNGKYANKTDESVAILRADLSGARSVLVSATTQDELKRAYNKLVTTVNSKLKNKPVDKVLVQKPDTTDGKETVVVKAENTEPKFTDKSGSKDERNGKEMIEGSGFRSATEGYTLETTEKRHENGEFATATGKSYEVLDNNPNYKLYVHGYQSENTDRPSVPNETPASGGRADIPLSKEEAEKLKRESILWDGRIRPTAKKNNGVINRRDDKALENYLNILKSDGAGRYGAGGAYEFLATEIYGYAYEQGKHYVYIKDVKNRFSLSKEAQDAGYRISNIDLTNLIPGTGYDEKTDTIEGYVSSQLQNGVYDMRYTVTVTKPDNTTSTYSFANLKAGWMGWQDTTPPTIEGSSTVVKIGDTLSHDLKYLDNPGMLKDDRANYQYTKVVRDPQTNESREEDNGGRVNAGSQTGEN